MAQWAALHVDQREKVGRLTAEQAEIARLRQENARLNKRLQTTEVALDIMGKAHACALGDSPRARWLHDSIDCTPMKFAS